MHTYTYFTLILASIFLLNVGDASWGVFSTMSDQVYNGTKWPSIVRGMRTGRGLNKLLSPIHYQYLKTCRAFGPWVSKVPKKESVTQFGITLYDIGKRMIDKYMIQLNKHFSSNYFIDIIDCTPYTIRFNLKLSKNAKTIKNIREQIADMFKTYHYNFLTVFQMRSDAQNIINDMDNDYFNFIVLCQSYNTTTKKQKREAILSDMSTILNKYSSSMALIKNNHNHKINTKKLEEKINRKQRTEKHISDMRDWDKLENVEVYEQTLSR